MSAIEVLKSFVPLTWNDKRFSEDQFGYYQTCLDENKTKEIDNVLKEALLALEQKENLVEWLEKEIKTMEDLERINYTGAFQNDLRILKEVLERVGEQK